MTHQEFSERTGLVISSEDYATVERIYMAAGGMDKDNFCKAYKDLTAEGRSLATWMMCEVEAKQKRISSLTAEVDMKNRELRDLAEILLDKAYVHDDIDLYRLAVDMIGEREAVIVSLKAGRELRDDEVQYIINNLK